MRPLTPALAAALVPAGFLHAQCEPRWLPGVGTPIPPSSTLYAMASWDPDASGPLPRCITVGSSSSVSYWHNGAWRALNPGATPVLWAMGTWNGDLVAGGPSGAWAGAGAAQLNIARWTGAAWAAIGTQSPAGGPVDCILEHNGQLFVGGGFTTAGGQPAQGLARFDGAAWLPLPDGPVDSVYALTAFEGNLIAGGAGTQRLASWDGQAWTPWPVQPPSNVIEGLAVLGGTLIAGGQQASGHVAWRWTGSAWETITGNLTGTVGELIVQDGELVSIGGHAHRVMRRENDEWRPLSPGLTGTVKAIAGSSAAGGAYIGGSFGFGGYQTLNRIAHFDGQTFTGLGAGAAFGDVEALLIVGNDLIAAGGFTSIGGVPASRIARWDGGAWSAYGPGLDSTVHALAEYQGQIIAGGAFDQSGFGNPPVIGIARWDGAAWTPLGDGIAGSISCSACVTVRALAADGVSLYVAGSFQRAGGQTAPYIARWDGSQWHPLSSGLNAQAYSLAIHEGQLYVGGEFTAAGGIPAARIARWDGTQWHSLGVGSTSTVRALRVHEGRIVAAGSFVPPGGPPVRYIAAWDGAQWLPLGVGPNIPAVALGFSGSDLLVGGSFTFVDGLPSAHIARWGCPPPPVCYANCDNSTAAPTLNVADFTCFLQRFAAGESYANCDNSTAAPMLNVADFTCFLQSFAAGCP